jgi:acyl-CoA dehydrogenase
MQRTVYDEAHQDFREMVRQFIAKEVVPHFSDWERTGAPPKEFYSRAVELGILGVQIPEQFGGGGQSSFKFNAVLTEEAFRACTGRLCRCAHITARRVGSAQGTVDNRR